MRLVVLFLLVAILGSGCETLSGRQRRQDQVRLYNEIANLKGRVERLEMRLNDAEAGREDVYTRIGDLKTSQDQLESRFNDNIQTLDSKVAAQESARVEMRSSLVAELSAKMASIIRSHTPPAPVARTESGYEHIVKSGETLSAIAQAYGVKTSVISKANNLKNPDDLRVGQKLFIPE
jgi:LysM repeat protein